MKKQNIKRLTFASLMTALCIVIGWLCKSYLTVGETFRITFENLPLMLCGFVLGPAWGAAVGVASDLITCVLSGYGINPIITLGSAAVGGVAGALSLYIYNRKTFLRFWCVAMLAHGVGSVFIKSLGMYVIFGTPLAVLAWRVPLYICIATSEAYFCYVLLKNEKLREISK